MCPISIHDAPHELSYKPQHGQFIDLDTMSETDVISFLINRSLRANQTLLAKAHKEISSGDSNKISFYESMQEKTLEDLAELVYFNQDFSGLFQLDLKQIVRFSDQQIKGIMAKVSPQLDEWIDWWVGQIDTYAQDVAPLFMVESFELMLHSELRLARLLIINQLFQDQLDITWDQMVSLYQSHRSSHEDHLIGEVEKKGSHVRFDHYFSLCMFGVKGGFYTGDPKKVFQHDENQWGAFQTLSFSNIFSTVLAHYLYDEWQELGAPTHFPIVEMGAGLGLLAEKLHLSLDKLIPLNSKWQGLKDALKYQIVEISPSLAEEQSKRLKPYGVTIHRISAIDGDLPHVKDGLFISNELIDMFPPRKIVKVNGMLYEGFVSSCHGILQDTIGPLSQESQDYLQKFPVDLVEGEAHYFQPDCPKWLANMVQKLDRGRILMIDYGLRLDRPFFRQYVSLGQTSDFFLDTMSVSDIDSPTALYYGRVGSYQLSATGVRWPTDMTVNVNFPELEQMACQDFNLQLITSQLESDFINTLRQKHGITDTFLKQNNLANDEDFEFNNWIMKITGANWVTLFEK